MREIVKLSLHVVLNAYVRFHSLYRKNVWLQSKRFINPRQFVSFLPQKTVSLSLRQLSSSTTVDIVKSRYRQLSIWSAVHISVVFLSAFCYNSGNLFPAKSLNILQFLPLLCYIFDFLTHVKLNFQIDGSFEFKNFCTWQSKVKFDVGTRGGKYDFLSGVTERKSRLEYLSLACCLFEFW